jgi:hypothetical protein
MEDTSLPAEPRLFLPPALARPVGPVEMDVTDVESREPKAVDGAKLAELELPLFDPEATMSSALRLKEPPFAETGVDGVRPEEAARGLGRPPAEPGFLVPPSPSMLFRLRLRVFFDPESSATEGALVFDGVPALLLVPASELGVERRFMPD